MGIEVLVITPSKKWAAYADEVVLGSAGDIGILNNDASLLTALEVGFIKVRTGRKWFSMVLVEGVAEVGENKITVISLEAKKGTLPPFDAKGRLQTITKLSKTAVTKKERIYRALKLGKVKTKIQSMLPFKI